MTIRQQGGIFGRHPKFDTIETDGNADIGGDLTTKSLTAENTVAGEYTGIVVNNPSTNAAAISTIELRAKRTNGSQNSFFLKNAGGLALEVKNQFGYKHASFDWLSADITFGGNLIVANGKGIDFSATGGATGIAASILDDYEEGTWTPQVLGYDGTITVNRATYTKTGDVVNAFFSITFDGTVDATQINIPTYSLPFGISSDAAFCGLVCDSTGSGGDPMFFRREFATAIYAYNESMGAVTYTSMGTGTLVGLFIYQRT